MNEPNHLIFDEARVRMHRERARKDFEPFLLREMLARLTDRLEDISREFHHVLEIGAEGLLADHLPRADITTLEELTSEALPFAEDRFDLIVACGNLHWINDLPGALVQMRKMLKPDGLLLAMLPGGETLTELRQSFEKAEMELRAGVSPRISPFVDIRDAGSLLQRAGFALPVVDSERLELRYEHPLTLLHELRRMGQGNAMRASVKHFTPKSLMMRMAERYGEDFSGEDGRVGATVELVTLTAWKPHASQQQPARRGSGTVSLSLLGE